MKKQTIQAAIRAADVGWKPGVSRCFTDTTYTRAHKKTRLKFEYMATNFGTMRGNSPEYTAHQEMLHARVVAAVTSTGIPVEPADIHVLPGTILIFRKTPIAITEG